MYATNNTLHYIELLNTMHRMCINGNTLRYEFVFATQSKQLFNLAKISIKPVLSFQVDM